MKIPTVCSRNATRRSLAALGVALPLAIAAEAGFYSEPWIAVSAVYDDNIYYDPTDEVSDFIARVSPGLTLEYESERAEAAADVSFDAEKYSDNSELDSLTARKFANLAASYRATQRLTLDATAAYIETNTPIDLLPLDGGAVPGPLVGRSDAERSSVGGSASYRVAPRLDATVGLRQTQDEVDGTGESRLREAEAFVDQRLSERSVLSFGYIGRRFRSFEEGIPAGVPDTTQDYHIPWVGLAHDFNARTAVAIRGGPALGEDSTEPYVVASLKHDTVRGQWLADYSRTQTTFLGDADIVEVSQVSVSYNHSFPSGLSLEFRPNYLSVSQSGPGQDVYTTLLFGASYRLNETMLLTAGYEWNRQRVERGVERGGDPRIEVDHNVLRVGIRFGWPRGRGGEEEAP
jgi:predicted porin